MKKKHLRNKLYAAHEQEKSLQSTIDLQRRQIETLRNAFHHACFGRLLPADMAELYNTTDKTMCSIAQTLQRIEQMQQTPADDIPF